MLVDMCAPKILLVGTHALILCSDKDGGCIYSEGMVEFFISYAV
jgi:hypothetical protein